MGFFTPGYLREGKGVRKDEPKKKGIKRFFEIIARDFGDLVKLNFVFMLCCIPIVTIGPAIVALSAVMVKRVRDKPCYVIHEYKLAFKENFKRALPAGLIVMALLFLSGFSILTYYGWHNSTGEMIYFILTSFTVVLSIFITLASCYLFTLIAVVDLPLKVQLKNSVLLTIAFLPRSALILVTTAPFWILVLWFFPLTIILLPIYHFSITNLLVNMNVWAVIEKVFITNKQLAEEEMQSENIQEYSENNDDAEQ